MWEACSLGRLEEQGSRDAFEWAAGRVVMMATACGHLAGHGHSFSKHSPNTWETQESLDKVFELKEFTDE